MFKKLVTKSYEGEKDPVKKYCLDHSTSMAEIQLELQEATLKHRLGMMLGAPEVINLNSALIKALRAKKVLDIGVFTGKFFWIANLMKF